MEEKNDPAKARRCGEPPAYRPKYSTEAAQGVPQSKWGQFVEKGEGDGLH